MKTFDKFLKLMGTEPLSDQKDQEPIHFENSKPLKAQSSNPEQKKEPDMQTINNRSDRENEIDANREKGGRSAVSEVTVIGEHIIIEGTIRADEDIVFEGTIKGTVEAKSHVVTVGEKGNFEADIAAESVIVKGRMIGNIVAANRVQITKNADFNGQIKAKRISVEDGAFIKATIELERENQKAVPVKSSDTTTPLTGDIKSQKPEISKLVSK